MTKWKRDELDRFGAAEEIQIAALRRDGTLRSPVTIWIARVGDDLYVRSAYGRKASWFRGTQARREGQIRADGLTKEVVFLEADLNLNDVIDAAYRTKYRRYEATYVKRDC